jgi:hypothetical protein
MEARHLVIRLTLMILPSLSSVQIDAVDDNENKIIATCGREIKQAMNQYLKLA